MALQKTTITIPLGLGVNTKTDEKLVAQGEFNLVCENAVFEKVGAVKKRQAFVSLPDLTFDPDSADGSSSTVTALNVTSAASLNGSTIVRNQAGEYAFSHDNGFVVGPEKIPECKVTAKLIYPSTTTVDHTDCEYDAAENLVIAVARDGSRTGNLAGEASNKSTLFIYDVEKESAVSTAPILNGVGSTGFGYARCGVSRVSGVSYYYNAVTTSDKELKISIFNKYGQAYATSFTIAGMQDAGPTNKGPLAACRSSDGETYYFIAATTTANTGRFIAIRGTTKTFDVTFTFTGGGLAHMTSATAKFSGGLVYFAYNGARQIVFNPDGTVSVADAALSGLSMSEGIAYDQDSVSNIFGGASLSSWNGTQYTENFATDIVSDKLTIGGVPVIIGKSNQAGSDIGTYFLMTPGFGEWKSGQRTVAMIARDLAIDADQNNYLVVVPTRLAKISENVAVAALPRVISSDGFSSVSGLQLTFFEIKQDYKSNSRAIIGKNLHYQGGYVSEFDGQKMFENGFLTRGPLPVLDVATAGGLTGTYSYICVMKYVDSNGQISRSEPSASLSTTITSKVVKISVGTSAFGVKPKNCIIEIYRTQNGGSTFYLLTEVNVDLYSIASFSTIYTDETADAGIASNALLYTSGNVLANDPSPPCKGMFQGGNRLFLVGLEDENEIAYSKEKLFGECANFSDFLRIRIDTSQFSTVGGITAGGFMDDKIILFKRDSMFYVAGRGPNETGADNSFTSPDLISSESGCTDPRSVVLTPKGLMYKGEKGIYLLTRGFETVYIGAGVEEYNDYVVTSAVHLAKKNLVVFSLKNPDVEEGVQVSYDYYTEQWSVLPDAYAIDSDVLNGDQLVLNGDTNIPEVQSSNDFLDNAAAYSMRVKTPWIKVSGIQDFGRIWSCTILGKYKSAHDLIVKVRYDYDDSYVETRTITPSVSDSQYQYRIHLEKQKCEAVQFEIYDDNQVGESMELTALTLEVGVKKGSMKLSAGRKY